MSVFGDIISTNKPVLIVFYAGWHYLAEDAGASVQQVVDALGEAVRNIELTKKIQINGIPTYMIFHKGELLWRTEGLQSGESLINIVKTYIEA